MVKGESQNGNTSAESSTNVTSTTNHKHQQSCKVRFLDDTETDFSIDKNATGRDLFDKIRDYLNLREYGYFSLTYDEGDGKKPWLYMKKSIHKQLKKSHSKWEFEFRVKFYPPDVSKIGNDNTRKYLCLQVNKDILSGRLPCSYNTYIRLGSYLVQSVLGDYVVEEHGHPDSYLTDFKFSPKGVVDERDMTEFLYRVHELHKAHKGQTNKEAELNYLDIARQLSMYGVDQHDAQDVGNVKVTIGVCAAGVMIYKERLRTSRFAWPKILKISYRRDYFYIKIRPGEFEQTENTICFKMPKYKASKRLWKSCVEHHTFFRLMTPDKPGKTLFGGEKDTSIDCDTTYYNVQMKNATGDTAPAIPEDTPHRIGTYKPTSAAKEQRVPAHEMKFVDDKSSRDLSSEQCTPQLGVKVLELNEVPTPVVVSRDQKPAHNGDDSTYRIPPSSTDSKPDSYQSTQAEQEMQQREGIQVTHAYERHHTSRDESVVQETSFGVESATADLANGQSTTPTTEDPYSTGKRSSRTSGASSTSGEALAGAGDASTPGSGGHVGDPSHHRVNIITEHLHRLSNTEHDQYDHSATMSPDINSSDVSGSYVLNQTHLEGDMSPVAEEVVPSPDRTATHVLTTTTTTGQPQTFESRTQNVTDQEPETETHTYVDEEGVTHTVTRTIRKQLVTQTVQRQTVQTYSVGSSESQAEERHVVGSASRVPILEANRQIFVPVSDDDNSPGYIRTTTQQGVPVVHTQKRTVNYSATTTSGSGPDGSPSSPVAGVRVPVVLQSSSEFSPSEFVNSQVISSGNKTVETVTYTTEENGTTQKHTVHRETFVGGNDDDLDHDTLLTNAIYDATKLDKNVHVESIEAQETIQH